MLVMVPFLTDTKFVLAGTEPFVKIICVNIQFFEKRPGILNA